MKKILIFLFLLFSIFWVKNSFWDFIEVNEGNYSWISESLVRMLNIWEDPYIFYLWNTYNAYWNWVSQWSTEQFKLFFCKIGQTSGECQKWASWEATFRYWPYIYQIDSNTWIFAAVVATWTYQVKTIYWIFWKNWLVWDITPNYRVAYNYPAWVPAYTDYFVWAYWYAIINWRVHFRIRTFNTDRYINVDLTNNTEYIMESEPAFNITKVKYNSQYTSYSTTQWQILYNDWSEFKLFTWNDEGGGVYTTDTSTTINCALFWWDLDKFCIPEEYKSIDQARLIPFNVWTWNFYTWLSLCKTWTWLLLNDSTYSNNVTLYWAYPWGNMSYASTGTYYRYAYNWSWLKRANNNIINYWTQCIDNYAFWDFTEYQWYIIPSRQYVLREWTMYSYTPWTSTDIDSITSIWWVPTPSGWWWWIWDPSYDNPFNWDKNGDWEVSLTEFFSWIWDSLYYITNKIIDFFKVIPDFINKIFEMFTTEERSLTSFFWISQANAETPFDMNRPAWYEDTFLWKFDSMIIWLVYVILAFIVLVIILILIK